MLDTEDLTAFAVTLKLALVTTPILLLLATPTALWLVYSRSPFKIIAETLTALPLVLPPTVLGYYLLLFLGAQGPFGYLQQEWGIPMPVFSFTGLVIGSVIYSFPFALQPLRQTFAAIGKEPLEVAATLGANRLDCFRYIILPQSISGFISAAVLCFAHTIGEFGVALMLGGNIPGSTKLISMMIYEHAETLNYARANTVAGILLAVSFIMLTAIYIINRRFLLPLR